MRSHVVPDPERWNRNVHYHGWLIGLGPARRVLDVGCGSGLLARQLAEHSAEVVGIDLDAASLREATAETPNANVTYVLGDVLGHPFEPGSFDLVVSVAALHHMDAATGLRRFAELVAPGGTVGVVGIGRSEYPRDVGRDALAFAATRAHQTFRRDRLWHHRSPVVWPPPLTDREMQRVASDVLPGSTFRRRLHGRHSIVWTRPSSEPRS